MKTTFPKLLVWFLSTIIISSGCGKTPVPTTVEKQGNSSNNLMVDIAKNSKKQIKNTENVILKDRNNRSSYKTKTNEFVLAIDIPQFIERAKGNNENEKIINGITDFTDNIFDYYIDLFKSKSIYSIIESTDKAISTFQQYKRKCGTHQIKEKYLEIENEGKPSSRNYKIREFKSILVISRKADIPNYIKTSLFSFYLNKNLKFNKNDVKIHSMAEIIAIVGDLQNQIDKIKVP